MSASGPSRPIRAMLHHPRRPLARGVLARLTAPLSIHSSPAPAAASASTSAFRLTTARASARGFNSRATSARAATQRSSSLTVPPALLAARKMHTSAVLRHGELVRPAPGTGIKLTFRDSKGNDIKTVEACEGDDILSLAHEHDVDLEGEPLHIIFPSGQWACERSLACSTCHVIISPEHYALLPEPEDEENDMLDLAFGLEDTSRLGCQVKMTRELDGMVATLPSATRNMYVDGAKARTH